MASATKKHDRPQGLLGDGFASPVRPSQAHTGPAPMEVEAETTQLSHDREQPRWRYTMEYTSVVNSRFFHPQSDEDTFGRETEVLLPTKRTVFCVVRRSTVDEVLDDCQFYKLRIACRRDTCLILILGPNVRKARQARAHSRTSMGRRPPTVEPPPGFPRSGSEATQYRWSSTDRSIIQKRPVHTNTTTPCPNDVAPRIHLC